MHLPTSILPATFIGKNDHPLKYTIPNATIDNYKFAYYPRCIRLWNRLPSAAVYSTSPDAFHAAALPAIKGMKLPVGSKML